MNNEVTYNAIPKSDWYVIQIDPSNGEVVLWILLEDWQKSKEANDIARQLSENIPAFVYWTKNFLQEEWNKKKQRHLTRNEQKEYMTERIKLHWEEEKITHTHLQTLPRTNKSSGHAKIKIEKSKPIKREPLILKFIQENNGCTIDSINKYLEDNNVCITAYSNNTKSAIHVMKRNIAKNNLKIKIEDEKVYIS